MGGTGCFLAASEAFDAIILDRMLPGGIDGLRLLETLRAQDNKTPVMFLSALGQVDERVRGLKAGGDDYLTKPFAFAELLARVEALTRRGKSDGPQTKLQVGDLEMELLSRTVRRAGQRIDLQPREFRLLEYMMRHAGQVVTRTMLLEGVWDYHFDPQTNVIRRPRQPAPAKDRQAVSDSPAAHRPQLGIHAAIRVTAGRPHIRPSLWRSAGLRLAVVYAVLFALSALALVLFLWWATAGLLDRQVEAAMRADAQGLSEQWSNGGPMALRSTIEDRLAENVDDDAIYLLADPAMHPLAGNLATWPTAVTATDVVYELMVSRAGMRSMARVQRFDLPDGSHLLVGRDVETRTPLRSLLTSALLWSLALLLVLGLVGGVVMQRLFRRMIASVSATAGAIAQGDLSQRVRASGRGDEFDRLAETINDMLDRIGRLMDGVRAVSNSIAHDLRTPIARARARLEDAAAHSAGTEELRAAIGRAVADLDGVSAIFDALLRIAEIEAGTRRGAFADLDLADLLGDLADLFAAPAEEKGLTLAYDAARPLPVHGDRDLIGQAVVNLLDNALKFSPPGATVRLHGQLGTATVVLSVQDGGPGIPECDRVRATERFYRGEQARQTPGSGLGLALVDAVAHLHGGTLALEDAAPGLRAVLTLPARPLALPAP